MWMDAHVHLADERLRRNWQDLVSRSMAARVTGWVEGGINPQNWASQRRLKESLGASYHMAFGLHPWWVAETEGAEIELAFQTLYRDIGLASVLGETGLDFSPRFEQTAIKQREVFRRHLELAQQAEMPLVLHVVRAHGEALALLEALAPFPRGGLVHSFNGSPEVAERYLKLGFLISVGGAITYSGHRALKEALPKIPSDRLVLETDTPDQLPRTAGMGTGIMNEPQHLIAIAQAVAELRGETTDAVLTQSTTNLKRLLTA